MVGFYREDGLVNDSGMYVLVWDDKLEGTAIDLGIADASDAGITFNYASWSGDGSLFVVNQGRLYGGEKITVNFGYDFQTHARVESITPALLERRGGLGKEAFDPGQMRRARMYELSRYRP